jgi:hypothetical protein
MTLKRHLGYTLEGETDAHFPDWWTGSQKTVVIATATT